MRWKRSVIELERTQAAWKKQHDEILSGIAKPANFRNPSLLDDYYEVVTGDEEVFRKPGRIFRFDPVVKPGGVRLNTEECVLDLITCRLFVILAFDPEIGWSTSAASVWHAFHCLLTMIRWRNGIGIDRMARVTEVWFDEFIDRLSEGGGVEALIPVRARFDAIAAEILSGQRPIPLNCEGNRRTISMSSLLAEIGVERFGSPPYQTLVELERFAEKQLADTGLKMRSMYSERAEASAEGLLQHALHADLGKKVTSAAIADFLLPFEKLQIYRHRMQHDPIGCAPFGVGRTRMGLASTIGENVGRTPCPPDYQTCFLVDRALRWVISYGADLLGILGQVRRSVEEMGRIPPAGERPRILEKLLSGMEWRNIKEGLPGVPWPLISRFMKFADDETEYPKSATDLRTALFVLLPVACFIIIATFSARRREELLSLRDDCIETDDDGDWLHTWIEKTLRKLDRIPCPGAVRLAVDVLKELSLEKRTKQGTRWIFDFSNPISGTANIEFNPDEALRTFTTFVGVPALADGSFWHFTSHQYRKFFAVVYIYRFRFPNLTALSNFYRHFNIDITRRYASNAAKGGLLQLVEDRDADDAQRKAAKLALEGARTRSREFEEIRRAFVLKILCLIAIGDEPVGGYGGQTLKSELTTLVGDIDRDKLRTELAPFIDTVKRLITISPSSDIKGTISEKMIKFGDGETFDAHPEGSGYCRCTSKPQHLNMAECLKKRELETGEPPSTAGGKDLRYASDDTCAGCVLNSQLRENGAYWRKEAEEAENLAKNGITPHLRETYAKRQAVCERQIDLWHPETRDAETARVGVVHSPKETEDARIGRRVLRAQDSDLGTMG
jgi:integrase